MHWIKPWRDWAMIDLWPLNRIGPRPQALHFRYEKAGLILDNQSIPWNAEAVLVEAAVRLPGQQDFRKGDFRLRLCPTGPSHPPESLYREKEDGFFRLIFRINVPPQAITVEVLWRERSLGQMTLPVLQEQEFRQHLGLHMPSLQVRLGERTVPCQTYVGQQCDGLMATALLSSPTSLVPIADLGLHVNFRCEQGGFNQDLPVEFTSSQLKSRQTLITVVPRKPRRLGNWQATWMLGDVPLATQRIKSIGQRGFQQSLRISQTRFVLRTGKGEVKVARVLPPLDGIKRVGPCFLISSSEQGMAGLCHLQVRAQVQDAVQPPLLMEQEVLITDGPSPFAPGTLDISDLSTVTGFELRYKNQILGVLPMVPAPSAIFSSEGSFKPPPDFMWSPAADDQLNERLAKLIEGRGG